MQVQMIEHAMREDQSTPSGLIPQNVSGEYHDEDLEKESENSANSN
jgi:hypothetical protein